MTDSGGGVVSEFTYQSQTMVVEQFASRDPEPVGTFVIVHGLGMGCSAYEEIAQDLREHANVVTVDLPGFGEAPEPPRTPTMQRLGDLVAAFLEERDFEHVTLIGHSMGTQVVSWAIARHQGCAERAVLVAPTVDDQARTVRVQAFRLMAGVAAMNPKTILRGAREYLRAGPHVLRKTLATVRDTPEDAYPRMRVPVLVLRGEDDTVVPPAWAKKVQEMLPESTLREIEGRGHGTILRDTHTIANQIAGFAGYAGGEPLRQAKQQKTEKPLDTDGLSS